MPLDTGGIADDNDPDQVVDGSSVGSPPGSHVASDHLVGDHVAGDHLAALRPVKIVLDQSGHVGEALKAARLSLGLAPEDLSQVTRVRAAYIDALEAFRFDSLPARPFVVGYVRAYAQALGLDAEAVVARFHAEAPKVDGKLRAPGGVRQDAFASIRWLMVVGAMVAAAVLVWNLTRRAEIRAASPVASKVGPSVSPRRSAGPTQIGAPLATPPEASNPPVYQTPGLGSVDPAAPAALAAASGSKAGAALTDGPVGVAGARFVPAGTVYGAGPSAAGIILQAHKSTSLVVRGPAGAIYFARVLAPGEAWRGSPTDGLVADVADPSVIEVFVAGVSRGHLAQTQTSLAHLGDP